MANKTPEYLLRMKTEGPKPVLFDSSKAVDHWWRKGAYKCQHYHALIVFSNKHVPYNLTMPYVYQCNFI